jgi:hypothetical protein
MDFAKTAILLDKYRSLKKDQTYLKNLVFEQVHYNMWKGRYGGSIGGEIGLYTPGEKGRSLTRRQLGEIGVISSSIQLFDKRNNGLIFEYTEEKPSY